MYPVQNVNHRHHIDFNFEKPQASFRYYTCTLYILYKTTNISELWNQQCRSTGYSILFPKVNFLQLLTQHTYVDEILEIIEKISILIANNYFLRWIQFMKRNWFDRSQALIDCNFWKFSFLIPDMDENEAKRYIVDHSLKPTIKCIHASQIAYFRNKQWQSGWMHSSELHMFGHL